MNKLLAVGFTVVQSSAFWLSLLLVVMGGGANRGLGQIQQLSQRELNADRLIRRDLTPIDVDGSCPVFLDGVQLPGGEFLIWSQVIGVSGESDGDAWREWNRQIGEPWFLLQSRLERGERYRTTELARQLADVFDRNPGPSWSRVEVYRWLAVDAGLRGNQELAVKHLIAQADAVTQWKAATSRPDVPAEALRLQPHWSMDPETGICFQLSPSTDPAVAQRFLQATDSWRTGNVSEATRQILTTYRLIAAADVGPQALQAEWLSSQRWMGYSEELEELIDLLLSHAPDDLQQYQRLRASLGAVLASEQRGEITLACTLVGKVMLKSTDRQKWMWGATCLMNMARWNDADANSRRARDSGAMPWRDLGWRLVVDRFEQVGEPGKVADLRRALEASSHSIHP